MKKNTYKMIPMQSRLNLAEKYYTNTVWETKIVDGVEFLPVIRKLGSSIIMHVRKDSLQQVTE